MGSSVDSTGPAASPPADRPACPTDLRDELRITTISLSGKKNFLPWAHSVRRVLQAKGLLSYLTQASPDPPTDEWLRNDGRVQTWLLNSLDGEPYQMAMYHETAKSIWDELHSLYSGKDSLQHLYDIITDLVSLDTGGAPDMTSFVARAKTLAEAWILHQPSTTDHAAQRAQKEAVCIAIMMARLPPHLQCIRAQVLASSTVPSLSEICSMLLRVTPPPDTPAPTSSAFVQQASPPLLPSPPSARGGRSGSRGRGRGGRGRPKCSYCGKDGHFEATCYRKNGYPPRPTASVAANASSPASPDLEAVRLQLQHLQGLLNPPPASLASTFVSQAGMACLSTGSSWIMDSGATHHITSKQPATYLDSPHPRSITVANGALIPVSGSTDISLSPSFPLRSALHVPSSPFNLLSVGRLTADLDCSVTFTSSSFVIQDRRTQTTIGKGGLRNGFYLLDTPPTILSSVSSTEWHRRLGHAPLPVLQRALPDISLHPFQSAAFILSCSLYRSSAPFDLLHSDVWGPYKHTSISGFRYFITFIDDYSRLTWLYLLRDRSEIPRIFRAFIVETRTQFQTTIKTVRTDNAREYVGHDFTTLCSEFGILHQTSCAYTPQQNGVAEHKNRHLLDVARSLMLQMHVPKHYWNFAVSTACFLINRLPSSVLHYATPFNLLFPSTPPFPLPPRIFGSTCYVHHLGPPSDKLDPRAAKHIFVGYSRTQKGYLCYSPATRKLSVSADVTFRETQPFFSDSLPTPFPSAPSPPSIPRPVLPVTTPLLPVPPALPPVPPAPPIIRVYTRRPPCSMAPLQSASTTVTPRPDDQVQTSTAHPLAHYVSLHRLSPPLHTFATSLSSVSVPNSVQEALQHPGWRAVMEEKMAALWTNRTWTLVPLPPGQKPVGCKWVFVIKHAADGTIDRLKARLVARGFTQQQGLDYEETFSPVAKLNTVRVLLSVAVHHQWPLLQLDVKNAFLNGDLQETVYMQQPPGFETTGESQVCHLRKALYGLKQSPRAWFDKFSKALREIGFTRSSADFSLFTRHRSTGTVLLLVYVDDIIITGNDSNGILAVKLHLSTVFQTKDLGPLRYFLGLEVARRSDGLILSQRKYCTDLLHDAGYSGCKPIDTPMDVNHKLCAQASDSDTLLDNPEYYRRLVGKLIYLTVTRPDISFAVGIVSRYMHSPRSSHLQAVERILRYLKKAPGQGLVYKVSSSTPTLVAYSDADYAGSLDDRRSTSGFCTYFGGHLITWRSKKQAVVARSSAEAEYRAMASVVSELTWLESLLTDLDVKLPSPALLLCDSQAAIHIAKNPVFHERTKHIEVDCHFIREKVQLKKIDLRHVPGTEQVADVLTKALSSTLFYQCLSKLGAYDLYAPACGGVLEKPMMEGTSHWLSNLFSKFWKVGRSVVLRSLFTEKANKKSYHAESKIVEDKFVQNQARNLLRQGRVIVEDVNVVGCSRGRTLCSTKEDHGGICGRKKLVDTELLSKKWLKFITIKSVVERDCSKADAIYSRLEITDYKNAEPTLLITSDIPSRCNSLLGRKQNNFSINNELMSTSSQLPENFVVLACVQLLENFVLRNNYILNNFR
ncbi:hypothetical protein KSP39_PZI020446 [Platanthera zijinensis]|uniref:Integrase catalytic domain-containing protein n=1 Tax=Platanthera zijinensis TaxID=2320716 RepID=A0AAP0AZ88_9ASPA